MNLKESILDYMELEKKIVSLEKVLSIEDLTTTLIDNEKIKEELAGYKNKKSTLEKFFYKNDGLFKIKPEVLLDVLKKRWDSRARNIVFYSPNLSMIYSTDDFYGSSTSSHNCYILAVSKSGNDNINIDGTSNKEIIEDIHKGEIILLNSLYKFNLHSASFSISNLFDAEKELDQEIYISPTEKNKQMLKELPLISLSENKYFQTIPNMPDILTEAISLQQAKNKQEEIEKSQLEIASLEEQLLTKRSSLAELKDSELEQ